MLDPEVLDSREGDIILTLCQLEMYFLPLFFFFDVMVHLISHIVREIKFYGLSFYDICTHSRDIRVFEKDMSGTDLDINAVSLKDMFPRR